MFLFEKLAAHQRALALPGRVSRLPEQFPGGPAAQVLAWGASRPCRQQEALPSTPYTVVH